MMFKIALCLLLNATILSAQTTEAVVSLRDFSGGLNDNTTPIALKPNESPDLLNVEIDNPVGGLKTRAGFITCGSIPSGNIITATHEYIRLNGNHELILTDNITVYSTLDCVTFSTITTGLGNLALPYFDTFRDKLWIVNMSASVITWDGATTVYLNGTGSLPNPPKGQYITHWKERAWLARTNTEPSSVYFSALTDATGANINPSISSAAWPAVNAFYIAQDDGSPIYGMKVYKDNLFIFKRTGIWRIIFESEFNTQIVQSVSNVGCKFQDSIVELDNLLYFVGEDGIYKFDGNEVMRISQNIDKRFKTLKQPSRLDKYQLWNTPTDWIEGTLVNTSTTPYAGITASPGSLSLDTYKIKGTIDDFTDGNYTSNPVWTFYGPNNYFMAPAPAWGDPPDVTGKLTYSAGSVNGTNQGTLWTSTATALLENIEIEIYTAVQNNLATNNNAIVRFYFLSTTTNTATTNGYMLYVNNYFAYPSQVNTITAKFYRLDSGAETEIATDALAFGYSTSGHNITHCSRIAISATASGITATDATCGLSLSSTDIRYRGQKNIIVKAETYTAAYSASQYLWFDNIVSTASAYRDTGSFTSQVSTFSLLSQWRTFDVDQTLNGQSITYQVKTASTPYNLGLTEYNSITPGAITSTITANKNFQWKANFTTYDASKSPLLNSAIANYQEGDVTTTRLAAINYDNRYWLTGSTSPATPYNDIMFVKSKGMDTWTIYDTPISAFTKWNNNLYGGIANTAKVARLNFGTNDDGAAINAYWTWGDQHWPKGLSYKHSLRELYLYYTPVQSAANSKLSYSHDGGTNYTDLTINLTGTAKFGLARKLINGGIGNAFRFKVSNNAVDQSLNILGLDAWATPYINRE